MISGCARGGIGETIDEQRRADSTQARRHAWGISPIAVNDVRYLTHEVGWLRLRLAR